MKDSRTDYQILRDITLRAETGRNRSECSQHMLDLIMRDAQILIERNELKQDAYDMGFERGLETGRMENLEIKI